jgi:type II secretory ATPase GspE/PulE/Tfp pilus assembly ATPase PilB-like protein
MNEDKEKGMNDQGAKPSSPIGEYLVRQGFITREQLDKALDVQREDRQLKSMPIGQILVKKGIMSQSNVDLIVNHPQNREKLGELAIKKGFISHAQLEGCLQDKKPGQLIGQVLIENGFMSAEDLGDLLRHQVDNARFGELAIKLGVITINDLKMVQGIQRAPRSLGRILCDLKFIDPLDLNKCLAKAQKRKDFGETLVAMGYISKEDLNTANKECQYDSEALIDVLLAKKLITEERLQNANSYHYNIPFKTLDNYIYAPDAKQVLTKIISRKYAETKLIIPISCEGKRLEIGLFRPETMLDAIYEFKEMYRQYSVSCVLITKEKYEELFEILYSTHLSGSKASENGELEPLETMSMDFMSLNIEEEFNEDKKKAPTYQTRDIEAEELVNFIISYGIVNGASDIHLEQSVSGVKLRYRMDGILRETNIGWLKEKLQEKSPLIVSRIKILSNLDISEKRLPQDGSFRTEYFDKIKKEKVDLDFRVATCKAAIGENVTIRILDPRKANIGLENLSHSPHVLKLFREYLKSPAGMILVCGPTGSGKTSTLYAALKYINKPDIKIITAEDPIEFHFPALMQTQVNAKIGLTFARLLRSFLRFDPDVILIGEMRDEETAKIGFDAAQTGHLLLSTLHTNDAISAVMRLVDLGVEYGQIASSLMCVLAQRLIRRICPSCIEEYIPEKEEWSILFNTYPSHLKFYRGRGCEACNYSGYGGRTLISEIFAVTVEIAQALNKGYDESQISRLALESGMKTMLDDGLMKLNQTTLSEIIRMVPHDMIKKFRARQHKQDDIDSMIENMLQGNSPAFEDKKALSSTIEIVNPETERASLDLILARYEDSLKIQNGGSSINVEPRLFKEFLVESFYRIYEQQPCKSMSFSVQNNPASGKVEISVIPNP